MIKINRVGCPAVLENSPSSGTTYKRSKVVKTLWQMQHGKCCYCEQKIPEEGHSKWVEHFRPKSIFKYLKNDWKNLLLACPQCNGAKLDKFPVKLTDELGETKVVYLKTPSGDAPLIINPSHPDIDPEEHLSFIVDDAQDDYGLIFAINDSEIGALTIDVVGLSQKFYINKRRGFIHTLTGMHLTLLMAKQSGDVTISESYKAQFQILMSATGEFAAVVRAFAKHKRLDEKFGIHIPTGAGT